MNIKKLISKYESNRNYYISNKYNETQLRTDFLDPFFKLLGWDISNDKRKATNEREVLLEEPLKTDISTNTKKPDYTFRLFSERKFFLEAKKPNIPIESDASAAKQVRRYGFTAKLKISVLSNFEYLAIYDCSQKVDKSDQTTKSRIKLYHYKEYENAFNEIKQQLGRDEVYSGDFDKTWLHIEKQLKLFSIDKLFLKQINEWRLLLGNTIYNHKQHLKSEDLNDIVQSYINSIVFLRVCEDRNLEEYKTLLTFANKNDFLSLIKKFKQADKKYNSGLFNHILTKEIIENNKSAFWEIIKQLYYPESTYSFSVFSSDILGNIYEIFLGEHLLIENNTVKLVKKLENIDRDVVTTPTFIIQAILKDTVIKHCKDKTDQQILNLTFGDISCGSGSFLLETYQLLNDILIDYYLGTDPKKLVKVSVNMFKLPFALKKQILENCLYGVDKDYNAVEACKFGLLLKLLEDENNSTISMPALSDLSKNIFFGNSLFDMNKVKKEHRQYVNPFDFKNFKFDVIIGNPPYMATENIKQITPIELPLYKKNYVVAYKQFDKYFLFIERALQLLKKNGVLGYIIPSKFLKVDAAKKLRQLLKNNEYIDQLISFGSHQIFQDKTTYTCLLIMKKIKQKKIRYFEVKNLIDWKTRKTTLKDFDQVEYKNLDDQGWVLVSEDLKKAFYKINEQSILLSQLLGDKNIYNGIQTSANKIYIQSAIKENDRYYYFVKDKKNWKIEKAVTRPYYKTLKKPDNLNTYRAIVPNSFVIYPYHKIKNKIEFIKPKEFKDNYPFAYEYLLSNKEYLSNPKRDVKPIPETKDEWYRYGRHQSLEKCDVPKKIIVGVLSQGNKYAIDYKGTLITSGGTAGYCMLTLPNDCQYSIYYIQALLNSKYLEWYASLIGEVFRGGYIARGTKVLKRLPIRIIDFKNKKDKDFHDKISFLQKELINTQKKIDNSENKRQIIPLKRQFESNIVILNDTLKQLYNLKDDDHKIPLIREIYEIN
ncbi:MAG: adenine methyltransferase [Bacteroidetes bacterium]|nr:adenine methyltransferase [Bacteroidota bacterium]